MKKYPFLPHARRAALSVCKLILIITAFLPAASSAQAQTPVDLSIFTFTPTPVRLDGKQDIEFQITVFIEQRRQASGAVVTAELPEGVTPSSVFTDQGTCSYSGNLVTCNLGVVGREGSLAIDWVAFIEIRVKPTAVKAIVLTARITANEPDPNLSNNITTAIATVNPPKSGKRLRLF